MSALAPTLQAFFTDRLVRERGASPRTIASYRDTWRLLVRFVAQRSGKPPSSLEIDELDAPVIVAFLEHLEAERRNGVRTRNLRLAAIRCGFRGFSYTRSGRIRTAIPEFSYTVREGGHVALA